MMKKLFPFILIIILTSCSNEIPSHRLVENGGLFYEIDSNEPFSGSSVQYIDTKLFSKTYLENGIIIKKETFYPDGKPHTTENFTEGEGGNKVQVFDEKGKDISDKTYLTYWGNGLVKVKGNYINGRREGLWEEFDSMGNSVRRNHWRDNKLLPIIDFQKIQLRENIPFLVNSNEPFSGIIRFKKTEYTGVVLTEFKFGKPEGFSETRYQEDVGGHINLFLSYQKGSSYNFEDKYIDGYIPHYREGSYGYGFHENGNKRYESIVKDGLSSFTNYFENGEIKRKGKIRFYPEEDWFFDGVFITYYENGQVRSDDLYDKGVVVSGKKFSDSGMDISNGEGLGVTQFGYPERKGYYLKGFREGKWEDEYGGFVTYRKDSQEGPSVRFLYRNCTTETGSYKNNKKEGEWIDYNYCKEEDDPSELIYYENGEKIER